MTDTELMQLAALAAKKAYSPYSHFSVGAALLCTDGTAVTGCNVENASFGASCCAERSAVFAAVSQGKRDFSAIAVVGVKDSSARYAPPCGICRQVLSEFCGADFRVVLLDGTHTVSYTLSELLPAAFTEF